MTREKSNSTVSRRTLVAGGIAAAASTIAAPRIARAAPPVLRYAVAGVVGPGELETVISSEWMKANVLKRHGKEYTIEVTTARGTPGTASLMAAGQADMGTIAFPIFATLIQKKAMPNGMRAVADIHRDAVQGYASNPYCVLDDSPIREVKDLKGKTVAVNAFGGSVDIILRFALKQAGLDPKTDVKVVELPFANIGPALRQKRIDVGTLAMPFQVDEIAKGGVRKVFDAVGVVPPYSILFQTATDDLINKRPEVLRAWLTDYVEAQEWIYDPANRAKAVEVTADLMKTSAKDLGEYFLTKRDFYRDPHVCIGPGQLQPAVDAMFDIGLLPEKVAVADYINTSFLPFPCKA